MKTKPDRAALAKEMLNKFPAMSTRHAARKLLEEYPLLFDNYEQARSCVKYYRAEGGERKRLKLAEGSRVKVDKRHSYNIPRQRYRQRKVHRLPADIKDVVILSDIHFPNHDAEALTIACEYLARVQPGAIVLNGDILDNTPFTKFRKPPTAKFARGMFDMALGWLDALRKNHPDAIIWWVEGNHDRWYKNWLIDHCEQVFDDPYYQLEARMQLERLGIKYVDEFDMVMAGKLPILHGHTVVKGVFAPVNSARGAWLKTKHTCIIGHTHQVSQHTERNLAGDVIKIWSQGCLCTVRPEYDPHNTRHSHGFAHVKKEPTGKFIVHNYEIIEGELR